MTPATEQVKCSRLAALGAQARWVAAFGASCRHDIRVVIETVSPASRPSSSRSRSWYSEQ